MPAPRRGTTTPDQLRKWRARFGFTQQDAAHWYGCSIRSWSRYETGESPIPLTLTNRIKGAQPVKLVRVQDYP